MEAEVEAEAEAEETEEKAYRSCARSEGSG